MTSHPPGAPPSGRKPTATRRAARTATPLRNDEAARRRAAFADDVRMATGIDEAMIQSLVHTFYARIRDDAVLGPIFASRISDWGPHLARMCDFWSSVMLMTGRYHGRPMPAHATLPIEPTHFERWLALFEATAHDVCPPHAAVRFVERAHLIAESLARGIAIYRGEAPPPVGRIIGGST